MCLALTPIQINECSSLTPYLLGSVLGSKGIKMIKTLILS